MGKFLKYFIPILIIAAGAIALYTINWGWSILFVVVILWIASLIFSKPTAGGRNWAAIISRVLVVALVIGVVVWGGRGIVSCFRADQAEFARNSSNYTPPRISQILNPEEATPIEEGQGTIMVIDLAAGQRLDVREIEGSDENRVHYRFFAERPFAMRIRDRDPNFEASWDMKDPADSGRTFYMFKAGTLEIKALREPLTVKLLFLP